jgi:hypothetical protein
LAETPAAGSASGDAAFRTIDESAVRCGAYAWLEHRLFELTGSRASAPCATAVPPDAEIRVFLSEASARHALLAGQWRERLPVRAGVDADALVAPPPGGAARALDLVECAPDLLTVLAALVEQVLPRLLRAYEDERPLASPVNEAPVRAVLELAGHLGDEEVRWGLALLERARGDGGAGAGRVAASSGEIQRILGSEAGIIPAARGS